MALDAFTIFEYQTGGSNNNGGGAVWDSLVNSTYKWTLSGSGTNEYYCELAGGGDPSLTEPSSVTTDGTFNLDTNGTIGSLNAGEWDWGDNDTLGYSTVYVRLDDGADPDTKNHDFVSMVTGGGTDYSQQTSAQLNPTDLACVAASTTLTSATGGFTAAMVGNIVQVTAGTNFATGWYEIKAYTNTNTVTIDRTAASGGDGSSGTGYVGGCLALPTDAQFEAWTAGNRAFIKAGTYTLTGSVAVSKSGSITSRCEKIGYNSIRGDSPSGDDRPLIAAGGYTFTFGSYWIGKNIRVTSTSTGPLAYANSGFIENCYVHNSSASSNRLALGTGHDAQVISCELISTNGYGLYWYNAQDNEMLGCYIHDSAKGMFTNYADQTAFFSIFDTCGIGMDWTASGQSVIVNCVFYNCGIGLDTSNVYDMFLMNNIIMSCTTGFNNDAGYPVWQLDYNNYYNNTTDVVGLKKGPNATHVDPQFTNAAAGDFSMVAGSGCIGAGFAVSLGVG